MEFIRILAETIQHIAWPALVLVVFLMLREPLTDLIRRLKECESSHGTFRFGETKEPPVQPADEKKMPSQLSAEAKKILATLWERQRFHFQDDYSKRWSFRILPNSPLYGTFTMGFAELLGAGLAGWTRKDGQALLTNEGIDYIKKHPELQESENLYNC